MTSISEYVGVALASTIKFVGGPIAGVALKLSWLETTLASASGMMLTVLIILYGSELVGKLLAPFYKTKPKKVFKKSTRFAVKVKSKLGLWGIAIFTPFLFTPILGTFIALSFGFSKKEIGIKMLLCGLIAGFVQTVFFDYMSVPFMQMKEQFFS